MAGSEGEASKAGGAACSKEIASILAWLPPEGSESDTSVAAERLPPQFQCADSPERAVKQYLAMEAVPVLTQALMDLCLEEPPPPPGETIPWLIKYLEKLQEAKAKEKSG